MTQPCTYDSTLEHRAVWLCNTSPMPNLHPMIQHCTYGFILKTDAPWLNPHIHIRRYLWAKDHVIETTPSESTLIRWLNHAHTTLPHNKWQYDYEQLCRDSSCIWWLSELRASLYPFFCFFVLFSIGGHGRSIRLPDPLFFLTLPERGSLGCKRRYYHVVNPHT